MSERMGNRANSRRVRLAAWSASALLFVTPLSTLPAIAEETVDVPEGVVAQPATPEAPKNEVTTEEVDAEPANPVEEVPQAASLEDPVVEKATEPAEEAKPESSGETAFRLAADGSIFGTGLNTCTPGELYALGGQGEVYKVVNGELVPFASLPYGSFNWSADNSGRPLPSFNRPAIGQNVNGITPQRFDGMGANSDYVYIISSNNNQQGSVPSSTTHTIYQYDIKADKWYAIGANGTKTVVQWNTPTGKLPAPNNTGFRPGPSVSASFNPSGSNFTFNGAGANITMGAMLDDGTYLFAGTNGSGTGKIYALKPNGQIVYLGDVPMDASASSQHQGDLVVDSAGNLYISNATVNTRNNTYSITVKKIDAQVLTNALNRPKATWTGSSWSPAVGSSSIGATTTILSNYVPQLANWIPSRYNGFDISPNGNIVLSLGGSNALSTNRAEYTRFMEFDSRGNRVNAEEFQTFNFNNPDFVSTGNTFNDGATNGRYVFEKTTNSPANRTITDFAGCSSSAVRRPVVVYKDVVKRYAPGDQFTITEYDNVGINHSNQSGTTSGTTTGKRVVIAQHEVVEGTNITVTETFANGASADNYTTLLTCKDTGTTDAPTYFNTPTLTGTFRVNRAISADRNSKPIECTFTNTAKITVDLTITKVDEVDNATLLSGVRFKLYPDNGNNGYNANGAPIPTQVGGNVTEPSTNATGNITWSSLAPGNYWLVESAAPAGYKLLATQKITIPETGSTYAVTVTNQRETGSLTIEKLDNNRARLAGSSWRITGPGINKVIADSAPGALNADDVNNTAGLIRVENLPWGNYTLVEETAPTGYLKDKTTRRFSIGATNLNATFTGGSAIVNNPAPGELVIEKLDNNRSRLAGSSWRLTGPNNYNKVIVDRVPGGAATDDADATGGVIRVSNLAWGKYTLVEENAPAGYAKDTTAREFTIDANNLTRSYTGTNAIINNPSAGTLTIEKLDDKRARLGGSSWLLTGPGGYNKVITDSAPGALNNDDADNTAGLIRVENLSWGTYTLMEQTPPTGYNKDTNRRIFTLGANNLNQTYTGNAAIVNTQIKGTLEIEKISNAPGRPALGGTTWTLTGPLGRNCSDGFVTIRDVSGAATSVASNNDTDGRDGFMRKENLCWGEYTLVEKTAPAGYEKSGTTYKFTIDGTNLTQSYTGNQAIVNNQLKGTLEIEKVTDLLRNGTWSPLGGTTWTLSGPFGSNCTDGFVTIRDVSGAATSVASNNDTDGRDGFMRKENLCWGEYTLVERSAPTGYNKSENTYRFTIDGNNLTKSFTGFDAIENSIKPGTLTIEKVSDAPGRPRLGGTTWRLTGPGGYNQVISDSEAGALNALDTDNSAGMIQVGNLNWGTYTLVELTAPAGYTPDTTPREFTIGANNLTQNYTGTNAIVNRQTKGRLEIEKVSDVLTNGQKTPLAGTTWTLTGPVGTNCTAGEITITDVKGTAINTATNNDRDNRDGFMRTENLCWGDYTLVEKTAPKGYEPSKTRYEFRIDGNNLTQSYTGDQKIENTRAKGVLEIEKVSDQLTAGKNTPLAGTTWTLRGPVTPTCADGEITITDVNGTSVTNQAFNDADNRDGFMRTENLCWGTYTLVEKTTANGYEKDKTEYIFTIDANNLKKSYVGAAKMVNRKLGRLEIEKVTDAANRPRLEGTTWRLTGPLGENGAQGSWTITDLVGNGKILKDSNREAGLLTIENLPSGEYTLEETGAPAGYQIAEPETFTIHDTARVVRYTIVNKQKKGTLQIEKVSAVGRQKLAGSSWSLTGPLGVNGEEATWNLTDKTNNTPGVNDTNPEAGMLEISNLPWGTYKLVETQAPAGFVLSTKEYSFTIDANTQLQSYTGANAITNEQHNGPAIPHTGGLGRDSFIIGGFVLLGGAAGISLVFGRKRQEKPLS